MAQKMPRGSGRSPRLGSASFEGDPGSSYVSVGIVLDKEGNLIAGAANAATADFLFKVGAEGGTRTLVSKLGDEILPRPAVASGRPWQA